MFLVWSQCLHWLSVFKQKWYQTTIKFGLSLPSALEGISSCKKCSFYQLVHSFFITSSFEDLFMYTITFLDLSLSGVHLLEIIKEILKEKKQLHLYIYQSVIQVVASFWQLRYPSPFSITLWKYKNGKFNQINRY